MVIGAIIVIRLVIYKTLNFHSTTAFIPGSKIPVLPGKPGLIRPEAALTIFRAIASGDE